MDRDQDWITRTQLSDPNIIYTRGYSWENDVWTEEAVFEAFHRIYTGHEHLNQARSELLDRKRHLEVRLRWHVRADCLRSFGRETPACKTC